MHAGHRFSVRLLCLLSLTAMGCSRTEKQGEPQPEPASATPRSDKKSAAAAPTLSPAPVPTASSPRTAEGPLSIARAGTSVPAANAERVLHLGDSMVPLVGNYLKLLVEGQGHQYFIESVSSSKTTTWAEDPKLESLLKRHNPDLVLISLGSNELFDKDLKPIAQAIKKLVARLSGRACLWVGPPAWAKDAGFIATLKQNLQPCRYLDSIALDLPRADDGRHPTWSGGHRWATAVWQALGGVEPVPTGH